MERAEPQPNLIKLTDSEDLRLREPLQNIRGLDAYDSNGEQIGTVEDLYVDQEVQFPRFLDVGTKVLGSPDFDPAEMPEVDFQRAVYAYYGYS